MKYHVIKDMPVGLVVIPAMDPPDPDRDDPQSTNGWLFTFWCEPCHALTMGGLIRLEQGPDGFVAVSSCIDCKGEHRMALYKEET